MSGPRRGDARRDLPIYLVVAGALGLALFWPPDGAESRTLDMDEASTERLVTGWSEPERHRGVTFTWAVEHEAVVRLPVEGRRSRVIALRAWPAASSEQTRRMAILLNQTELGTFELDRRPRVYTVHAPASAFRPAGEHDVLELRFSHVAAAPGNDDSRRLAAAVDWIRIVDLER